MKTGLKRLFSAAIGISILASSCGRTVIPSLPGQNPNIPGQNYYDPVQNGRYNPSPDTHGYTPNQSRTRLQDKSFAVLKNTFLRVDPEIGIFIKHLEGELEPKRQGDPVIFDDIRSFVYHVYRGQMTIDGANITRLMNKYVFNYPGSPLKDLKVEFLPGRIRMSGKMKQAMLWIPFEQEGPAHAMPDGNIKLVPDKIIAGGLPSKGLMDFIGLKTDTLLKLNESRGVKIQGNEIIMYPTRMFPPPAMTGRVVNVQTETDALHISWNTGQRVPFKQVPDARSPNYMHSYGGNLLMMNELHRDADLQMVDMDPSNPFDFFLEKYKDHLGAGYVKMVKHSGTLITLMPDYPKVAETDIWDQYPGGSPRQNYNPGPPTTILPAGYNSQGYARTQTYRNRRR